MTDQTERPAPLVPADIDVDGINGFLLHTDRLFHSELWALSTGEEFKAAVALWGHAWRQKPAGSLPNDDRLLAAFSGTGARWKKVRAMALRGFVLCSDGRYYHRVLCEDVLRAAQAKDARRERTSAALKARQHKGDPNTTGPSGGKKGNGIKETTARNVGRDVARNEERNDQRDIGRNDIRHERRDVDVASATCGTLRSPIEVEVEVEEKRDIPPTACSSVPAAAAAAAWNSRENFDRVERRCREVLPGNWVVDPLVSPVVRLEVDGLDLEREIIPAILDIVAGSRVPIRTWTLLANRIAERVTAQRDLRAGQGLPAVPPASTPPEDLVDLGVHGRYPEATLRLAIARWRESASWIDGVFGPPPGEQGCRVPARLLIGEAA